jgi:hypothetical protein
VLAPALYAEAAFRTPSWVGREAGPLRG